MSDVTATASPVTESAAPTSSVDVAAQVVQSYESGDASGGGEDTEAAASYGTEPAEPVAAEPATERAAEPAKPQSEASKAAEFLRRLGHDLKRSDGRKAFMPVETVAKMLDRYVDETSTGWTTERSTLESRAKELESHLEELRSGVSGDPRAFIAEIARVDPRYQAFLQPQAAPQAPAAAPRAEMPAPDLQLPDGSRTYSLDGLQALLEWNTAQVESRLLPKVDERLKPFAEREQQEKVRAEREQAYAKVHERVRGQATEAQTWPGFKDHEADILKALQEDSAKARAERRRPTLSLEAAYRQVVVPRLIADDTARRERLLKEINGAPKSTALGRGSDAPKTAAPASSADIVRGVLAKLEA